MEKVLADLLTRSRAALKAEATALSASADKDNAGVLTAEQDARFKVIEADIRTIDAQMAAAQVTAETPEQIADRVRAEIADVTAACDLAGKPERAAAFIAARTPQKEVVSTLMAERVAGSSDINPRNPGTTESKPLSWAEFRAKRAR
ncbi:MAG: hypothetical protein E5V25_19340 [Mesorhizobium sp.]|nr:MAG: hypothetical protein E5V25_19340 [Mesorhizobium sp.]